MIRSSPIEGVSSIGQSPRLITGMLWVRTPHTLQVMKLSLVAILFFLGCSDPSQSDFERCTYHLSIYEEQISFFHSVGYVDSDCSGDELLANPRSIPSLKTDSYICLDNDHDRVHILSPYLGTVYCKSAGECVSDNCSGKGSIYWYYWEYTDN